MIARLAIRNLNRNAWRSLLTVGGVAVAVALMIWMMGFMNGWMDALVRGMTAMDTLQIKIERQDYVEDPASYHSFELTADLLESLEASPEVLAVTARVKLYGLIGNEERSQVAQILGVDARREAAATPIADAIIRGKWLGAETIPETDEGEGEGEGSGSPGPAQVVLGEILARQLRVDVGDELVVFLEAADGSLGNEVLIVTGVVRTSNSLVDRQAAYMQLEDAQYLGALEGQIHEIAVRTTDAGRAVQVAEMMRATVATAGFKEVMAVRSWQEISPQLSETIDLSKSSMWVLYLIVYLVASLGIMNAQRMSALERRREFAVLMAIGVTPGRLFRIIVAETIVLGVTGALIGAVLGIVVTYYHATAGIDLAMFSDQTSFSYMGVAFTDRLYTSLDVSGTAEPVLVMLGVALVCGLWPALQGARTVITSALSGRS